METCCGYEYDRVRQSRSPSDFQGPSRPHRTPQKVRCSSSRETLAPGNLISGSKAVKKKRQLFPGASLASPSSFLLPDGYAHPGSGILTGFPFDKRRTSAHVNTEFPYLLGSTHPCPTAVHMEPFSTSVFKVLI